jgi:hypothetical protein
MADGYDDTSVEFSLAAVTYEDVVIRFEAIRDLFTNIGIEFFVESWDYYNFQNVATRFEVEVGDKRTDIAVLFSIIKAPQNYSLYIMSKVYSVTTEVGTVHSDLEIFDWNVSPNQTWYLKVNNTAVYLYSTQADLLAGTNLVAYGVADANLKVILAVDEYEDVGYYYSDLEYHLKLSELIAGDRFFKIKPFTDLDEIRDPIYNNSTLVVSRGEAELNLHSFATLSKEITLGCHLPEIEVGDIVTYTSTRRNKTQKSQVLAQTISGNVADNGEASLITILRTASYLELFR